MTLGLLKNMQTAADVLQKRPERAANEPLLCVFLCRNHYATVKNTRVFIDVRCFFTKIPTPLPRGDSWGGQGGPKGVSRDDFGDISKIPFWWYLVPFWTYLVPFGRYLGPDPFWRYLDSLLEVSGSLWEVFGSPFGGIQLGGDPYDVYPNPQSPIQNPKSINKKRGHPVLFMA